MTVKLSSLRVTAEVNAEQYIRGMAQKVQADEAAIASTRKVARELAAMDAASAKTEASVKTISRSWVEGYGTAARFEAAIRQLGRAMDKGLDQGRAVAALDGIYRKFGQVADAAALTKQGFVALSPVIEAVNRQYDEMARKAERAAAVQTQVAQAQRIQTQIAQSTGILQGRGKSAAESAGVFAAADIKASVEAGARDREQALAREKELLAIRERIMNTHFREEMVHQHNLKTVGEINTLRSAGKLTEEQKNEALRVQEQLYQHTLRSTRGDFIYQNKYGTGAGLARHEAINLSRQLQDVFVSLQGGQAPLTVLIQQGTQIADIFAASSASIGGFARQAGTFLGRVAFSFAGLATAALSAGAAVLYFGNEYGNSQREIERVLSGVGRASGLTANQINLVAEATAHASRISVSSAREIATTYAATGRIGPGILSGLTGITKDYSRQTGQDLAKAAEELGGAFSDPIKGAETLNAKLGFLDARTQEHIRSLIEQNKRSEAQKVLLDAVSGAVQNAADRVSWYAKAWEAVKKAASDAGDAIGRIGSEGTLDERLQKALVNKTARDSEVYRFGLPSLRRGASAANDEVYNLQEQIRLQGRLTNERQRAAASSRLSLEVLGFSRDAEPEIEALRKINEELAKTKELLASVAGRAAFGDDARLARLADRLKNAQSSFLTPEQTLARTGEVTAAGILARSVSERTIVEMSRLELEMAGKKLSTEERRLMVANKLLEIQAQANREARDALRSANDNYSLAGLNPYQRAVREAEIRERENRVRFGNSTGASVPAGNVSSYPGMTGLNQSFAEQLKAFIEAATAEGLKLSITSGYRSIDEQARLYAQKPHLAAPPGRSNHNFGLAADLGFGPGAQAWAHANAARFGLSFPLANRPVNPEAWHVEPINARAMRGAAAGTSTTDAAALIKQKEIATHVEGQFADALRNSSDKIREEHAALDLLEKQSGMTAFGIGKMRKEQELINQFTSAGIPITDEMRKKIAEMGNEYGRLAERAASVKLVQDALFERSQLGRTPNEQGIASRLRGLGIREDSPEGQMLRMNYLMSDLKDTSGDALKGFLSDLRQGKSLMEALNNVTNRLLDKLLNASVDMLMAGLFGGKGSGSGLFGGFGGSGGGIFGDLMQGAFKLFGFSANGNAFGASGLHQFALGGAFTNSIVSKPTLFPFANGVGLMGEAGDEAIMPLKRNSRGQLAVHAVGAGNDNRPSAVNMNVKVVNNNGSKVSTSVSRGENGEPELRVMIDRAVEESLSSGRQDGAMKSRYGNAPRRVRR